MSNQHILIKPVMHLGTQNRGPGEDDYVLDPLPTYSVIFNGIDEYIRSNPAYSMGFGNVFSQALWWWQLDDRTGFATHLYAAGNISEASHNRINFVVEPGNTLRVINYSSAGTIIKSYFYNNLIVIPGWNFAVATWDGTDLVLHHNGSTITPVRSTDEEGTMTDAADRGMTVAAFHDGLLPVWEAVFWLGLWNKALTADEASALYNGGSGYTVNWRVNSGDYKSGAKLQHWWRLGHDPTDIGKDYSRYGLIDLMDVAVNVDADDLVPGFYPPVMI